MTSAALAVALAVLCALAVLQVLVIFGLPFGAVVWGGQHRVLPGRLRLGSTVAVILYAGFAALLLSRSGVLPGSVNAAVIVLTWVLFAFFAVSVVGNVATRSSAERWTMTPASVVLAVATFVIAVE
ncbi:hypothetical protein [Brevibacterium zhoupengii]|uniref:hypothetical protein n=1 Tax=Brevibacterium zhoupengii TaxID=2898795 RepID=UPI001E3A00DC|nr:hypothetical protein [Brevibacterium zhoupengii]